MFLSLQRSRPVYASISVCFRHLPALADILLHKACRFEQIMNAQQRFVSFQLLFFLQLYKLIQKLPTIHNRNNQILKIT